VSDANVNQEEISAPRSDWVALLVITTMTTCTKPYDNKTTTRTSFSCKKQEAESQVFYNSSKSDCLQKSVIVAKSKPQINKLTLRLPISKEQKPCLIRQIKSNCYTDVTAAIDGQVSKIDIQPGQLVVRTITTSTIMKRGLPILKKRN
jgi:membrane fusion protein (multidrug efflux system)